MNHSELNEKLRAILSRHMKSGVGAASFAVWRGGEPLASCAVGAEPTDLFALGSVSKIYCAAAVMILVDRGLVDLDAPVCRYLPRFTMADERYKKITVRMALNHSSGLPGTCVRYGFTLEPVDMSAVEDCFYDYFAHSTLKSEPGTVSVYCNDGFTLAELVVKEVSGLPLADFVRKEILEKIGAERTCYTHEEPVGPVACIGGRREVINFVGAGGALADMADLCRFGELFLPGRSRGILSPEACEEMRRPQGRSLADDRAAQNYGLGWDTVCASPAEIHFGPNMMGVFPADCLYDYGEGALSKAGTSTQVKSLLVVLPKYDTVAAMAVTLDTRLSRDVLLPELLAEALESEGVSIRRENPPADVTPCPADETIGGYYLSGPMLLECRVRDSDLTVFACIGEMRIPLIEKAVHRGGGVFCAEGHDAARFVRGSDRYYLQVVMESAGMSTTSEQIPPLPPLCEAWRRRIGSRWICVNGDPADMAVESSGAFASVGAVPCVDDLLVFRVFSPDAHEVSAVPFHGADPVRGGMFMDGPYMSSRDSGEPIVETVDGREELYFSGMRYVRVDDLPTLESGRYTVGERALAFRLPEERDAQILSEEGQAFLYDAAGERTDKPVRGGYALLMGRNGARFSAVVSDKE